MSDSDHPNAHLDDEMVQRGVKQAACAFRRCRMTPRTPETGHGRNSLLLGDLFGKRFVVYVRITLDDETEDGVGPTPGVLIEAAQELDAEPHVIRVHIERLDGETMYEYFGYREFIDAVLANESEWNHALLPGRSVSDYLCLVHNKLSRLRIENVVSEKAVKLQLLVDGQEPYPGTIDAGNLLRSTIQSDEYDIFTCTCGEAGCAGIWRGVIVVNEGPYTLWKAYFAKGRRIFVFDRSRYRREILLKVKEAVDYVKCEKAQWIIPYQQGGISYLKEVLHQAEESPAPSNAIPSSLYSPSHAPCREKSFETKSTGFTASETHTKKISTKRWPRSRHTSQTSE